MSPRLMKALVALGWVAVAPLLVAATLRVVAHDATMTLVWVNAVTFYLYSPAYLSLGIAALTKQKALAAVGGVVVLCHLVWVLPDYGFASDLPKDVPAESRVRVFSANLLMVNQTSGPIIDEIAESKPDILLFQEFSPIWQDAIAASGLLERYPHREGVVREDSFGTAIFSSIPLADAEVWMVRDLPMTRASVEVAGRLVHVINVHTLPPRLSDYTEVWHAQMKILVDTVRETEGPVAVIGDFNATQHSVWYKRLAATRLLDAHRERGRGNATTFPNGLFPLPSLRLDHAFLSPELACLEIAEGRGWGSDHRPLILDIAVLPDAED